MNTSDLKQLKLILALVLATATGRRHIMVRETEARSMIRKLLMIV